MGIDGDDPDHIMWIYEHAVERASQYGITGVNYRLTQGEDSLTYWLCEVKIFPKIRVSYGSGLVGLSGKKLLENLLKIALY